MSSSMNPDLYKAAMWGDALFLSRLIGEDPSVLQTRTPQADTALHVAAGSGHMDIVDLILRAECDLLASQNAQRDTPLHVAARAGHATIVSLLLNRENWPADIESQQFKPWKMTNEGGNTPLHVALRNRNEEIASILLEAEYPAPAPPPTAHTAPAPPPTACIPNARGETPFHMAAAAGLINIAGKMLEDRETMEAKELEALPTPLHLAVNGGHISMVGLLLERRSNLIKLEDGSGDNALHGAALKNYAKIVGMLLDKDRKLAYLENNEGLCPIHVAAANDSASAIKEILRCCPDAAELVDSKGNNALHIAVKDDKMEALGCLLKNIEPVKIINQGNKDGNTPLHLAVKHRRRYAARELLRDERVDPWVTNKEERTPRDVIEMQNDPLEIYELYMWERLIELEKKNRKTDSAGSDGSLISRKAVESKTRAALDEQFKFSVQTYTLVAALIATVTFAAAFSMPGGFDQQRGHALLAKQVAFHIFLISDTVALCSSLIVVFCFMWAWKEKMRFKFRQLRWGHRLTVVACLATIATFVTAVYLVVADQSFWLAVMVILVGFATPFLVLAILGKDILSVPL